MNERILIVEDDPDTLEMLASYFQRFDYNVRTAAFGEQAVEMALHEIPHLIILDIRLPDIDGYEVCRRLRDVQRTSAVPIIFLTEKRERRDKIAGLELGAEDYITKPFDIHELRLRVENTLRRAGHRPLTHPVSGLPGKQLLLEHLHTLPADEEWALACLELEGVEAFSDRYGFVARDDLLRAVSVSLIALVDALKLPAAYTAHAQEAQFYLLLPASELEGFAGRLAERLERVVATFYPALSGGESPAPAVALFWGHLPAQAAARQEWDALMEDLHAARRLLAQFPH